MSKILIQATEKGLSIPSEYNKLKVQQMIKDGTTLFELTPRIRASRKQQGYVEGALIGAWGKYQYDIDPRDPMKRELARTLFKQDWNHVIIKDKDGKPRKVAQSLSGKHKQVLDKYMELAPENGYPIPNNELYIKWRDEYSMMPEWADYWDWLAFLGLEEDSMPSQETFNKLKNETN